MGKLVLTETDTVLLASDLLIPAKPARLSHASGHVRRQGRGWRVVSFHVSNLYVYPSTVFHWKRAIFHLTLIYVIYLFFFYLLSLCVLLPHLSVVNLIYNVNEFSMRGSNLLRTRRYNFVPFRSILLFSKEETPFTLTFNPLERGGGDGRGAKTTRWKHR